MELHGLLGRSAPVQRPADVQGWRLDVVRVHERTSLEVFPARLRVGVLEEPRHEMRNIGDQVLADQVSDRRDRDGCRKASVMTDQPGGHETAVAATRDAEPCGIGDTSSHQMLDPREVIGRLGAP